MRSRAASISSNVGAVIRSAAACAIRDSIPTAPTLPIPVGGRESARWVVLDGAAKGDLGEEERDDQSQRGQRRSEQKRALGSGREAHAHGSEHLMRNCRRQFAERLRQSLILTGDQTLRS